jgi:hypothetical protein
MSSIGPNFRPQGRQRPSAGAHPAEGANQASAESLTAPAAASSVQKTVLGADGVLSMATLLAQQSPLAPGQLAQLLRNLLGMPREMVQLLALLSQQDPAAGQALLQTLLTEDIKIPLEAMQDFLQERLDKAQEKLLKLVQGNPAALLGVGEMGELIKGLSELAAKGAQTPAEALHSTITLYLPFYPLHPPQAFSLRFEPPEGEVDESGGGQMPQLVIYIETITLGLFRVAILTSPESCWQALVSHDPVASPFTQSIEQGVLEAAPLEQPTFIFSVRTERSPIITIFDNAKSRQPAASGQAASGTQSVGLHPVGGVSVLAIHAAYLLIRVILTLDNQHALNQGRIQII